MKSIIGLVLLLLLFQSVNPQKPAFFRVYNANGKKLNKGELFQLSDTSITLTRKNIFVETPVSQIEVIKSKRTTGHRILITTLSIAGAGVFLAAAVYGLSRPRDYVRPGNINRGGSKSGSVNNTRVMRKTQRPHKKYKVNGNAQTWEEQRKLLVQLL